MFSLPSRAGGENSYEPCNPDWHLLVAHDSGFEPVLTVSETGVLPLDDS
jgi:hypothetical protein